MKPLFPLALITVALLATSQRGLRADEDPVVSGKKVSEWIADLKSGDTRKAVPAAEKLGEAGEKAKAAIPALIQLLGSKDRFLVYIATAQLGKFGAAGAAALVEATKRKDEKIGKAALRILRSKYPEASEKVGFGSVKKDLVAMSKLEASSALKGTSWLIFTSASGNGGMTSMGVADSGAAEVSIRFADKDAEWTRLSDFQPKPGKASYTIDTGKNPARIELKVDKDVYRGIYAVTKGKDKDSLVSMKIELAGAGEDYPAKFFDGFPLPRGSKSVIFNLTRVK